MSNVPRSITFFPNGTAAVGDIAGRQLGRYQYGWHRCTIAMLELDGVNWQSLDIAGSPQSRPPGWWDEQRESEWKEHYEAEATKQNDALRPRR